MKLRIFTLYYRSGNIFFWRESLLKKNRENSNAEGLYWSMLHAKIVLERNTVTEIAVFKEEK